MKLLSKVLLLSLIPVFAHAQSSQQIDSVYRILEQAANDTVRMKAYSMLGGLYDDINSDSGLYYCNKGISIAEKLDFQLNKAEMLAFMSWPLMKTGNYPEALKVINEGFKITEDPSNEKKLEHLKKGQTRQMYRLYVIGLLHGARESLFGYVGDYEKQIAAALEAIPYVEAAGDMPNLAGLYPDIGDSYIKLNKFDSAIFYLQKSLEYHSKLSFEDRKFEGSTYTSIGTIYEKTGNTDLARENYKKGIQVSELYDNPRLAGNACLQLASLYQSLKIADSSFVYAKKALDAFKQGGYNKEVAIAYRMISDYYWDKENSDSSFAYLRMATALDDDLDEIEKTKLQEFQVAAFNQQLSLQQLAQEQIEKEGRLKTIAIMALVTVFSTIGFLLYRNNRQKKKANQILQEKNNQIEQTLSDLKTTQKQLIQSEKMASLGELTAGIAHEIQNPLNFVNNFSEVNKELITEMLEEIKQGNYREAEAIAKDVNDNQEKINHHGRRADGIVKGMLQHSRSSSGVKEPTDINALCDEYVRLAYHGMRAKDKSFNAKYITDFDPSLPKVNVVPQEMGRVVLNLINNAFYAVNERAVTLSQSKGDMNYDPTVIVTTKNIGDKIEISVKDKGNGIPDSIKEKIFQPFFTTKPTGSGTGLGLSLSYDIVKAHGGSLNVESTENVGTIFTVNLEIN